ncbi:DNA-binding transcriptional regulator, MocR family, contains an aminotransferase domain [Cupriavidus sp. YR651]|uniref:aminotransferase-like domain-containing protein n=1 Tax=Cupriavidus sp. YR651 TaxID=1855315 RepID=UPI0008806BB6|nr:PLP-dependent aminotransferase family protein [Cupriavidus sp. YR651]SDD96351.1 DNA-binding transcriptional regulator, MocR family, contains an aminotransferase domain [Cupriavidus sp. YR651]
MARITERGSWAPVVRKSDGPVYLAIADALASDILSGALSAGTRLPPQRSLADALGIDFTTVSRAYAEARRRGLVEGRVGQGTYVRPKSQVSEQPASTGVIDMSMNLPPRFDDAGLVARMWSGISSLEATGGLELLLRYQEAGGTAADRAAGALWLSPRIPTASADRVMVCPGTQGALLAVAGLLAAPGDCICAEALTYPGFRSLAAHLRIRLISIGMDENGLIPEEFDAACQTHKPKALYCTPTLHNPTTATMPIERRESIVAVARKHGVPIIEDDAYGILQRHPAMPLAALAPEMVYYIAGLAKCLSPALRIAYVIPPDARAATRLAGAIRSVTSVASPLTAAIASRWIQNGTADAVVSAIRNETAFRQAIARSLLPSNAYVANPEGFHLWLPIPAPWTRAEFAARLRFLGVGVVGSDAFAIDAPPEAIRLSLGAPGTREDLRKSLQIVADLLAEQPAMSSMVV